MIVVLTQPFLIWSQLKIDSPAAGVIDPECELHEYRFTVTANNQGIDLYSWSREYGGTDTNPIGWLDIDGTPTGQTCDIAGMAPDVNVPTTYSVKVIVKDNPPPLPPPNPQQQTDERVFTFTIYPPPDANAGVGGNECDKTFALGATPSYGKGTWTKTAGAGTVIFTPNANDPNATVTVPDYGSYDFTWTEVIGSCSDFDVITVNFYEQPAADAGSGGDECDLDFVLDATPSVGTGTWTKTVGSGNSSFAPNGNDPDATVTVDAYGTYEFTWTETNGTCT
ncbi:hypothetical protein ACFLTU_08300, partial [Bacteroidota bacterium]